MAFVFENREADSPLVAVVWRTDSDGVGDSFTSQAGANWEMVFTTMANKTTVTVRGPETQASPAGIPENAQFFGIQFKVGAFLAPYPAKNVINGGVNLPDAGDTSFWMQGAAWELPNFENVDVFVDRLVRQSVLALDPVVEAVLAGQIKEVSVRSVQRRFLRTTGLTHGAIYQIQRARAAADLLQNGTPILDTVEQLGYSDQPHLTRALKHFMGFTPAQLLNNRTDE